MTLNCVGLTQSSVIQFIYRNVDKQHVRDYLQPFSR